jgi:hypothetical protein
MNRYIAVIALAITALLFITPAWAQAVSVVTLTNGPPNIPNAAPGSCAAGSCAWIQAGVANEAVSDVYADLSPISSNYGGTFSISDTTHFAISTSSDGTRNVGHITTNGSLTAGDYPLTVTATGASGSNSQTVTVHAVSGVSVGCGTDTTVRNAVNANPSGTTFLLAANCTYQFSSFVLGLNNDIFIGAGPASTIISGTNGGANGSAWQANVTGNVADDHVGIAIMNMTMQNFGVFSAGTEPQNFNSIAIQTSDNWSVRNTKLINGANICLNHHGNGIFIANNLISNCGGYTILGQPGQYTAISTASTYIGNEITLGNTSLYDTCDGSGFKLLGPGSVNIFGGYIHDNNSPGFWEDSYSGQTYHISGVTFARNGNGGVEFEDAGLVAGEVDHNVFIDDGNGSTNPAFGIIGGTCGANWKPWPSVWSHGSPNVNTHDNNFLQENGPSTPGGIYSGLTLGMSDADCRTTSNTLNNNVATNNTVNFKSTHGSVSTSAMWGTYYACNTGYSNTGSSSSSNHFHIIGGSTSDPHFDWFPDYSGTPVSFAAYRSTFGQDANSTIDTTDTSTTGCQHVACSGSGIGAGGIPLTGPGALSIRSMALSNSTFTPNVANGAAGTVSVTMSDGSAFSGTLSITGTNSGGFHLSGNTLQEKASGGTPAGAYNDFNIVATEANISNSPQQISPTVTGVVEAPFGGSARPITNLIQAEDYDLGGQGVAYNATETCGPYPSDAYRGTAGDGVNIDTTSDAGGGYKLGCNKTGDWHNYTITVPTTGTFTLNMRTANIEAGATYHVAIDGAIVVSGIAVSNTGSYDTFATVTSKQFGLAAGQHVMQIVLDAAGSSGYGGDFNWVQGTLVKAGAIGAKNVDITVTH